MLLQETEKDNLLVKSFKLVPGERFQVKGFENDMIIYISKRGLVQIITKQVKDAFQARENKWNTQKKFLMKGRIQATFESSTTRGIILENFRRNLKVRGSLCINKRCANHSSCLAWHPGLYRESGTCVLLWYWQTW